MYLLYMGKGDADRIDGDNEWLREWPAMVSIL